MKFAQKEREGTDFNISSGQIKNILIFTKLNLHKTKRGKYIDRKNLLRQLSADAESVGFA